MRYLYLILLILAPLAAHAQTFEKAVFSHKDKNLTRTLTANKRIVIDYSLGIKKTKKYRGKLVGMTPDTLYLHEKNSDATLGFALARIEKIRPAGLGLGVLLIVFGVLTLIGGIILSVAAGFASALTFGGSSNDGGSGIVGGISLLMLLAGIIVVSVNKKQRVNYPADNWNVEIVEQGTPIKNTP